MLSLNLLQTLYKMIKILAMPNSSGSAYWRLIDPLNTLKKVYPNEHDVRVVNRPLED